jgi:hypothetical protein
MRFCRIDENAHWHNGRASKSESESVVFESRISPTLRHHSNDNLLCRHRRRRYCQRTHINTTVIILAPRLSIPVPPTEPPSALADPSGPCPRGTTSRTPATAPPLDVVFPSGRCGLVAPARDVGSGGRCFAAIGAAARRVWYTQVDAHVACADAEG